MALLLVFVLHNIPFTVSASAAFRHFIAMLCPAYKPAGAQLNKKCSTAHHFAGTHILFNAGPNELSERLLSQQALVAKTKSLKELRESSCITITVDGWSNLRMDSIYACLAITPDRRCHMLSAEDLSAESHTGKFIAGK